MSNKTLKEQQEQMVIDLTVSPVEISNSFNQFRAATIINLANALEQAEKSISDIKAHCFYQADRLEEPDSTKMRLTPIQANLTHAALGIASEALEIACPLIRHTMQNEKLDYAELIKELGDLEFFKTLLTLTLEVDDDTILEANIQKLNKRYPKGKFDKNDALARADEDKTDER